MTSASVQGFVDPLVRGQLERRRIAGAVVVVVKDGAVVFSQGYGHADVASARAMTPETPVRIASITKTLTALAVMQLVENGKLDLDRDVNSYLDFNVPALIGRAPVTLRRLLSHQAGFEDRLGAIGAWAGDRLPLGPYLAQHMPPRLRQADDVVAYSNYNAALAAYIAERTSGQRFEQYLEDHIFKPLEMSRTTAAQPPPGARLAEVSSGYVRSDLPPTRVSMATATIYEVGSTGVTSPGSDMARLLLALLAPERRIVSRTSLEAMMTSQTRVPRGVMGLGLYAPLGLGGNAFIGHDGGTGGFHSTLALLPQERFGLFASYNSDGLPQALPPDAELLQSIGARFFADVRLPSSAGLDNDLAGTYQPARRVESNLFKLRELFEQVAIGSTDGKPTIRPAILPFGEPLEKSEPGHFHWSGRDVSFAGSRRPAVIQIGSPPGQFLDVSWWARASVVIPTVAGCLVVAGFGVLAWPVDFLRRRRPDTDSFTRRLKWATRLALLLDLVAISAAIGLVMWGRPLVAFSSPLVRPLGLGIYIAAWSATLLTPLVVWHAVRSARRRSVGSVWASGRDGLLAAVHVTLVLFCLHWRIAGTTLAF